MPESFEQPKFDESEEERLLKPLPAGPPLLLPEDVEVPQERFDVKEELKKFRLERNKLTRAEQRERFRGIEAQLAAQQKGATELVAELRDKVEKTPGISRRELEDLILDRAKVFRWSALDRISFLVGINKYIQVHETIERYRSLYQDDAEFFKACFGVEPMGKVEIQKGPFTLFFRCFNQRDYAMARNYHEVLGDPVKLEGEALRISNLSAGSALRVVAIPDLNDAVILENVSSNNPKFFLKENEARDLAPEIGEWTTFQVDQLGGDLVIVFPGKNIFEIKIIEKDEHAGLPIHLQCVGNKDPHNPIFDLVRVPSKKDGAMGSLNDLKDPQWPLPRQFAVPLRMGRRLFGEVFVNHDVIKIKTAEVGATIFWEQAEVRPVPNEKYSEVTRIHEEQHIFNRFFPLKDLKPTLEDAMFRIAAGAPSVAKAKTELIKEALRIERNNLWVDYRARDEILAYYQEGLPWSKILNQIIGHELYDPFRIYKKEIQKLPVKLTELFLNARWMQLLGEFYKIAVRQSGQEDEASAVISPEDIHALIPGVFKDEYAQDVKRWLSSIELLENKGYRRDEIVSLLYASPLSEWRALARRISSKS